MKLALSVGTLFVIMSAVVVSGVNWTNINNILGTSSSTGARVCVISNCAANSTTNVCGRYGSSRLCQRFNNNCQMRYQACVGSVSYTTMALARCSGIAVGSRRRCRTSSSSTSNVVPIIIRRG